MVARLSAALIIAALGLGALTWSYLRARKRHPRHRERLVAVADNVITLGVILGSLLFAAVLLLLLLLAFIRSPIGGQDLCKLATATIEDVARQRVVIDRCSVDPIGTRVVLQNVEVGPHEHPYFAAERLAAGLDHSGLFSGKVRIDAVEIVRPRVWVDLSVPSPKKPERKRPPGAACLPDVGNVQLGQISVTDGSLHLLLPEERGLALEGLGISIRGGRGDQLDIDLRAQQATLADAEGATTATRTVLEGLFDFGKGTAKVQQLEIQSSVGSLEAHGELLSICDLEGSANAHLTADLGLLHNHLLRKIPNLAGTATLDAQAQFKGSDFDAHLKADLQDTEVMDFEPGTFTIEARATPDQLNVQQVRVPLENGTIIARGTVGLASPFPLHARATFDGFSLGEVLERVGVASLPVHLTGSGEAHISGPLVTSTGMDLSGAVDMKVNEFGVYDRSWRRRKTAVRFAGFTSGALNSDFELKSSQVALSHTRITTHGSDINLNGTVFFDVNKGLDLKIAAPRISMGEIGPFARVNIQGQGQLNGTITGPYLGLDIRGTPQLDDARVLGYRLGNVKGLVDLDLAKGRLTATGVQAELGDSLYGGGGVLSFKNGVTIDARVSLDGARASDLMSIASPNFPFLARLATNVDSILTGDVELSGPAARPTIDAQLNLLAVNLYGQRFERGETHVHIKEARELDVSSLKLQRGVAELSADATLRFSDGAITFNALSRNFHAGDLDALAQGMPNLRGGLGLVVHGKGTLTNPEATGVVTLRDWYLDQQPLTTARLTLSLKDRELKADGALVSPWPQDKPAPATSSRSELPRPAGSMVDGLRLAVQLHDEWPFQLSGSFDLPDVSMVTKPGTLAGVAMQLKGGFHAEGLVLRPLTTTTAGLTIDDLQLRQARLKVQNSEPVHATFTNGVLTFQAFPLRGSLFNMDASGAWTLVDALGRFDLSGPKSLNLTGDMELTVLRQLVPDLDEASGRLHLDLAASSDTRQNMLAKVTGTASVSDAVLRLKNLALKLTNGNGSVSCNFPIGRKSDGTIGLEDGTVRVENLAARLNDSGTMSITGEAHLSDKLLRDTSLRMQLANVPFRVGDTPVVLSGTPTFVRAMPSDNDNAPTTLPVVHSSSNYENTLGGDLKVDRFIYTQDLELERAIVNAVNFSRRPPAPKVFQKNDFLKLDLGITFGDVQVRNNLLKAQLDGNLKVTGTYPHYGLLGTISFSDAKAHVRNVDYKVSSGVINFIDRSRPAAAFDIRADATVSHEQTEYQVHVTANGTPQQPKLLLSSDPPLSDADILTLITIGVISTDLERSTASATLGGVAIDSFIRGSGLSEQMQKLLPNNELLSDASFHVGTDYIEQTGNVEPVGIAEFKLINDNWKLRSQTSLLGSRGRKAEVDARLRKSIDAQLVWDGDKPSAPSYGDIGWDLRLHWERP